MDQLHITLVCRSDSGWILTHALQKVAKRADLITSYGDYPRFVGATTFEPKKTVRETDVLVFTVLLMSHNRDRKPFDSDGQYFRAWQHWKRKDGTSPLIVVMYFCEGFDEGLGDTITHRTPPINPSMREEMSKVDYYWFNLQNNDPIDTDAFISRLTMVITFAGLIK